MSALKLFNGSNRNHVVNVNPFEYGQVFIGGSAMAAFFFPGKLKKQSGPCFSVVACKTPRSLTANGGCEKNRSA